MRLNRHCQDFYPWICSLGWGQLGGLWAVPLDGTQVSTVAKAGHEGWAWRAEGDFISMGTPGMAGDMNVQVKVTGETQTWMSPGDRGHSHLDVPR